MQRRPQPLTPRAPLPPQVDDEEQLEVFRWAAQRAARRAQRSRAPRHPAAALTDPRRSAAARSAPCLRFPLLASYLPTSLTHLSLDCMLGGMDVSCLPLLASLSHLALRQFPAHHAAAMQAVGACTGLVRLRLDSRQAVPGLREMQVRRARAPPLEHRRPRALLTPLAPGDGPTRLHAPKAARAPLAPLRRRTTCSPWPGCSACARWTCSAPSSWALTGRCPSTSPTGTSASSPSTSRASRTWCARARARLAASLAALLAAARRRLGCGCGDGLAGALLLIVITAPRCRRCRCC